MNRKIISQLIRQMRINSRHLRCQQDKITNANRQYSPSAPECRIFDLDIQWREAMIGLLMVVIRKIKFYESAVLDIDKEVLEEGDEFQDCLNDKIGTLCRIQDMELFAQQVIMAFKDCPG